jgi:hypothetical protein
VSQSYVCPIVYSSGAHCQTIEGADRRASLTTNRLEPVAVVVSTATERATPPSTGVSAPDFLRTECEKLASRVLNQDDGIKAVESERHNLEVDRFRDDQIRTRQLRDQTSRDASDELGRMEQQKVLNEEKAALYESRDLSERRKATRNAQLAQVGAREARRQLAYEIQQADKQDLEETCKRMDLIESKKEQQQAETSRKLQLFLHEHQEAVHRTTLQQAAATIHEQNNIAGHHEDLHSRQETVRNTRRHHQLLRDEVAAGISNQLKVEREKQDRMQALVNELLIEEAEKAKRSAEIADAKRRDEARRDLRETYDRQLEEKRLQKVKAEEEKKAYRLQEIANDKARIDREHEQRMVKISQLNAFRDGSSAVRRFESAIIQDMSNSAVEESQRNQQTRETAERMVHDKEVELVDQCSQLRKMKYV